MSPKIAGKRDPEQAMFPCLTALLIGRADRHEFRPAIRAVRADSVLVRVSCLQQAERLLAGAGEAGGRQFVPDVVILAQSWPGQYADSGLDRLKRLLPGARFFALVGSWGEGEPRTGTPWPGAVRVYWYDWVCRWQVEKARLLAGVCPVWGLPETATADEQLLWLMPAPAAARAGNTVKDSSASYSRGSGHSRSRETSGGTASGPNSHEFAYRNPARRCRAELILIHTRAQASADALEAACRDQGYGVERFAATRAGAVATRPGKRPRPVAAIWDGGQCQPSEAKELACFRAAVPGPPIVALLDFPRLDGRARALRAGAAQVLSKPFLLPDLFWALAQAISSSRTQTVERQPAGQGHAA